MCEETKVIYHIDDEDTPYLVKLPVSPDKVTLGDFKNVLNRPNYKFFFKSMDDDFGVVKEEIIEDEHPLPCFNGRVVSWLVSADTSVLSDTGSHGDSESIPPPGLERGPGVGETRPPSFHGGPPNSTHTGATGGPWQPDPNGSDNERTDTFDDTESSITSVSQIGRRKHHRRQGGGGGGGGAGQYLPGSRGHHQLRMIGGMMRNDACSSVMSSEIDSSYFETEDNESMASSRFTTSTDATSVSRQHATRMKKQKRLRHKKPVNMSRASSISSITDSTLSLNIITVTLNMDTVSFLGISIVGQSNQGGDGGIYVGSIMKGGAVALDGRIEPGDMILQVNDVNFENMSNDDAVRVLRDVVQKPGPIKLVVAKCWDSNPKDYFHVPKTEPVRPIDPGAWVAHTAAVRGLEIPQPPPSISGYPPGVGYPGVGGRAPSVTTLTSSSPSLASTVQENFHAGGANRPGSPLTVQSGMKAITSAMQRHDSGLDVRDRNWLKITIHQAFIGSEIVDWLFGKVQGFSDRREAKKYSMQMLKAGFIKHTVNKSSFSEQCYYTFGDIAAALANCNLKDSESNTSDPDTSREYGSGHLINSGHGGSMIPPPLLPNPRETLGPLPPNPPPPLPPANSGWHPPTSGGNVPPYHHSTPAVGGSLGPIYNPAPPPSTYMAFNYSEGGNSSQGGGSGTGSGAAGLVVSGYQTSFPGPRSQSSSSGGAGSHLQLAASGSGSESEGESIVQNERWQESHNKLFPMPAQQGT